MCLLTFFPEGVMPDVDALLYGAMFNTDGYGYAVVDRAESRIVVGHGMDAHELIDEFETVRARHIDGPALFHSRFTTDGVTNLLNCHPFRIGDDPRTVMGHNGIFTKVRPKPLDPRSDTRVVAQDFIPKAYGTLRTRRARKAFERWMGDGNKVVILTVDRRFRGNAFILNESLGTWDQGIWYSNSGYIPYKPSSTVIGRPWHKGYAELDEAFQRQLSGLCVHCGENLAFREDSLCPKCWTCQDCWEEAGWCQCYTPRVTGKPDDDEMTTTASRMWSKGDDGIWRQT